MQTRNLRSSEKFIRRFVVLSILFFITWTAIYFSLTIFTDMSLGIFNFSQLFIFTTITTTTVPPIVFPKKEHNLDYKLSFFAGFMVLLIGESCLTKYVFGGIILSLSGILILYKASVFFWKAE